MKFTPRMDTRVPLGPNRGVKPSMAGWPWLVSVMKSTPTMAGRVTVRSIPLRSVPRTLTMPFTAPAGTVASTELRDLDIALAEVPANSTLFSRSSSPPKMSTLSPARPLPGTRPLIPKKEVPAIFGASTVKSPALPDPPAVLTLMDTRRSASPTLSRMGT